MSCIVQLTDLHIHDDPRQERRGVDARAACSAVLADVRANFGHADRLILTGDLAHDSGQPAHAWLVEQLGDLLPRCLVIPGNHDDRRWLRKAFAGCVPSSGPLVFSARVGDWQWIGLDSLLPGEVAGALSEEQLIWLEAELGRHRDQPAALFVHHPPILIGSDWLDEIGMSNGDALLELIARWPQVKLICTGHVHLDFAARAGSVGVFTTPSTCVQFSRHDRHQNDEQPPGYRVIETFGDCYQTRVVRVPGGA